MTEKKLWTLKVDEGFKALIPPLTDEERRMLEENILENGCDTSIVVWNGIIVDGHNRYEVCRKHHIPFAIEEKEYGDRSDVEVWMLKNQLGRRNLNDYQRSEMVLKLKAAVAEKAQRADGGEQHGNESMVANWPPASNGEKSREALGRLAGVSGRTLQRVKKIVDRADEQTKEELRSGRMSINKAYSDVMEKERGEREREERAREEMKRRERECQEKELCRKSDRVSEPEAARSAAKVASVTTEPVETYPVQGMAMYKGHPIHIGSVPEDRPEMFNQVLGLLDFAVHGYLADVREAMKWFGPNMRTPENVDKVESLIMNTCETALKLLRRDAQHTDENGKED